MEVLKWKRDDDAPENGGVKRTRVQAAGSRGPV